MAADERETAKRWLAAERAGRADEADRLFGGVAAWLPAASAPDELAERVARAAGGAEEESGSRFGARRRGLAVAVVFALATAAAVAGLVALAPFAAALALALLNFSAEGFVWVVRALDGGLDGWGILLRAGSALGRAISTPGVTGGLVVVELVGVAALYALHRLLRVDRESRSKEEKQW